jgi:hypothetical protein
MRSSQNALPAGGASFTAGRLGLGKMLLLGLLAPLGLFPPPPQGTGSV